MKAIGIMLTLVAALMLGSCVGDYIATSCDANYDYTKCRDGY